MSRKDSDFSRGPNAKVEAGGLLPLPEPPLTLTTADNLRQRVYSCNIKHQPRLMHFTTRLLTHAQSVCEKTAQLKTAANFSKV